MRGLELALVGAVTVAVAWPAVFGSRPRRGVVAAALTAALITQMQVEGYRWQMLPLYLLAVGLAVGDIFYLDRSSSASSRVVRATFGMLGIGLLVLLPFALPVPRLPVPPGPQHIGSTSVEIVDEDRLDPYGPAPESAPRRLVAQVWYPALESAAAEPLVWSSDWDVVAPAAARELGLPGWFLNHTRFTLSNSMADATVAPGAFPLVIYSHGWTGFRTIAVNQAEALASNGYIVIAIDHTYGSIATRFSDGSVAYHDPTALPEAAEVGEEAYADAAEALVETFAQDIIAVLDELELGDEGAFGSISGSIDLSRVGVYGHSTGGGAAVSACLRDERCDAVLGMDAWVEPLPDRVLRIQASQPTLFMRSDGWRGDENDSILLGIAGRSAETSYILGIDGASHNDFILTPLLSPAASQLGFTGPIAAGRVISIIDNYLIGFFDVYLLGTGSAALDSVAFDEVSIERLNGR